MTNNASFGTGAGPRQHLAAGQLRAVETGRTIVQAAVTGISAVIGPDGQTRSETGLYQDTVIRVQAPPRGEQTPYIRYGRGIEAGMVGVVVGGLILAGLLWRRGLGGVGRPQPADDLVHTRWDVVPPVGGKT
jgi:apolipoprotein N-acyltransferase